jgi:hypothetical protein
MTRTKARKLYVNLGGATIFGIGSIWHFLPAYTQDVIITPTRSEMHTCVGFGCANRAPETVHRKDRMPAPLPVGPP